MSKISKIISELADRLIQESDRVINALPPVDYKKIDREEGSDEEEFVLLLSDFQVGIQTSSFNFRVFKRRFENLTNNLLKVLALHRKSHPVKVLNVFFMGDLVHNENILRFVDLDELEDVVKVQLFDVLIPELINFFRIVLHHFEKVNVYAVHGNHGEMGRLHSKRTNLDDICYYFLRSAFRDEPRITFYLTERFFNIANIKGWRFLIVHGDQIPMHLTLPWYGLTTRLMRWQESIGDFDYLCLGHFHLASVLDWNNKTVFMNGTFLSGDEWTIKRLGLTSSLCQLLLGVHARQGVSFVRKIFLEKRRRR